MSAGRGQRKESNLIGRWWGHRHHQPADLIHPRWAGVIKTDLLPVYTLTSALLWHKSPSLWSFQQNIEWRVWDQPINAPLPCHKHFYYFSSISDLHLTVFCVCSAIPRADGVGQIFLPSLLLRGQTGKPIMLPCPWVGGSEAWRLGGRGRTSYPGAREVNTLIFDDSSTRAGPTSLSNSIFSLSYSGINIMCLLFFLPWTNK